METFKFVYEVDGFGSNELKDKVKETLLDSKSKNYVNLAFTDYGGTYFDKVMIAYLEKNHKQSDDFFVESTCYFGKNCYVTGSLAKRIIRETETYLLGFEEVEDFFGEFEYLELYDTVNDYLKDKELDDNTKHSIINEIIDNGFVFIEETQVFLDEDKIDALLET